MIQKIRNFIFKFFIIPRFRKNVQILKIHPDEDGFAYLLNLLQEDENKMYIVDRTCFDIQYNRELQEDLKKRIEKYGYKY